MTAVRVSDVTGWKRTDSGALRKPVGDYVCHVQYDNSGRRWYWRVETRCSCPKRYAGSGVTHSRRMAQKRAVRRAREVQ